MSALNSNVLGEFSIACDCAEKYVLSYPNSKEQIIGILKSVQNRNFIVEGEISTVCSQIAAQKAKLVLDKIYLK